MTWFSKRSELRQEPELQETDGVPHDLLVAQANLRRFADYWFGLPKIDLIPRRESFRPEEVPGLLSSIVIHELVAPEVVRLRLVGSAVNDDYGQEITGRNYLDFVEERRRAEASRSLQVVCECPAGMLAQMRTVSRSGRVMIRESIAFPVRGDGDVANLIYSWSGTPNERDFGARMPADLMITEVTRRGYIDIGAGVPDFRD